VARFPIFLARQLDRIIANRSPQHTMGDATRCLRPAASAIAETPLQAPPFPTTGTDDAIQPPSAPGSPWRLHNRYSHYIVGHAHFLDSPSRADRNAAIRDMTHQKLPATDTLIYLLGTTGAGKTDAAIVLAGALDAAILSIDSMQVYRRMDIGTAKPTAEQRAAVEHHLVDVAEPCESFSVARFVNMADDVIARAAARGNRILATAGTPLYLMGLAYGMFEGPSADESIRAELRDRARREGTAALHADLARVDPEAAERIHPNDYKRIERALEVWRLTGRPLSAQQQQWNAQSLRQPGRFVGIRRSKEDTSRRINARVRTMIEAGLVNEVRALLAESRGLSEQARQAVGYAEIIAHLAGELPLERAVERIKINTRRLAKHQRTWFRKFPMTTWIDVAPDEPPAQIADRLRASLSS